MERECLEKEVCDSYSVALKCDVWVAMMCSGIEYSVGASLWLWCVISR